jgi:hypothetical protein
MGVVHHHVRCGCVCITRASVNGHHRCVDEQDRQHRLGSLLQTAKHSPHLREEADDPHETHQSNQADLQTSGVRAVARRGGRH